MQLTYATLRKIVAARIWYRETLAFIRTDRSDATRTFLAVAVIVALWMVYQFIFAPTPASAITALI